MPWLLRHVILGGKQPRLVMAIFCSEDSRYSCNHWLDGLALTHRLGSGHVRAVRHIFPKTSLKWCCGNGKKNWPGHRAGQFCISNLTGEKAHILLLWLLQIKHDGLLLVFSNKRLWGIIPYLGEFSWKLAVRLEWGPLWIFNPEKVQAKSSADLGSRLASASITPFLAALEKPSAKLKHKTFPAVNPALRTESAVKWPHFSAALQTLAWTVTWK